MLGEIRIYVVDCDEAQCKLGKEVGQDTTIEEFADIAEQLGTVYTLSNFLQKINDEELNTLTNCFVKGATVYDGLIVEQF